MKNLNFAKCAQEGGGSFPLRGMFLHAWDLANDGVDEIMSWMSNAGLNTMCLAATYHSGWFIHPHNTEHRAFMAEGGVCYFHPHETLLQSGQSLLSLQVAALAKQKDWLEEAGKRLDRYGLRLVCWIVGTHNTRLGLAHPRLTQQNVYGDRLPHALCPANDAVGEYLKTLCRDIATHYPAWALQLESFGWMGFVHGHQHERDLTGLTSMEQELMGLCFCNDCSDKAGKAGVDVAEVKTVVKSTLDAVFCEAPRRPKGHPKSISQLESRSPELKKFNEWRKKFHHSLIIEIKKVALRGTDCRLLLQSGFEPELTDVVDGFACAAYQKTPSKTFSVCRKAKALLPDDWTGILQCFVQLGMGVPKSKDQLRDIIASVRESGCNGINFYNRSESPPKMLAWLADILPTFY